MSGAFTAVFEVLGVDLFLVKILKLQTAQTLI